MAVAPASQTGASTPPTRNNGATPAPSYPNPTTRTEWADELLHRLGIPTNGVNVVGLAAWATEEGGHWNNSATYNPLNTTLPMPGSHPMNSAGVQAYTSWDQGFKATIQTLRGDSRYAPILRVLGDRKASFNDLDSAVGSSPWGTPKGKISAIAASQAGGADGSLTAVIPGASTVTGAISGAVDAITSLPKLAEAVWSKISDPNFWLRVGQIVLGIVALIMGAMMIGKQYLPSR